MGIHGIMGGNTGRDADNVHRLYRLQRRRQRMVKSTLRRDWREARRKLEREGRCRVCGEGPWSILEAAHTIGRQCDVEITGPGGGVSLYVHPDSIVPLCKTHHMEYDARKLDLLPYLHIHEQARAVEDAGGIERARLRLSGPNG